MNTKDLSIKTFKSQTEWRAWLDKNHTQADGVWLMFFKKDSGRQTFTYAEALDEALCFGWIDGQSKGIDTESWIQKFTPRRTKSIWSKRNREHITRLIKEGKMTKAGLAQVESAKQDGRWESAYEGSKNMKIPADFVKELKKDKKAYDFFKTLNRANMYAIAWRLQTATKPETRERRMNILLEMIKNRKKIH